MEYDFGGDSKLEVVSIMESIYLLLSFQPIHLDYCFLSIPLHGLSSLSIPLSFPACSTLLGGMLEQCQVKN